MLFWKSCILIKALIKVIKLRTRFSSKRVSQSALKASLTVETAFVLPFFLFAFLQLLSLLDIFRFHAQLEAVLHQTAREMAVYAHAKEEVTSLSGVYVRSRILAQIGTGTDYPIKNGSAGISLTDSRIPDKDCIVLTAVYETRPLFDDLGFSSFQATANCVVRAFTGYDAESALKEREADEEIVYITEKGKVYHRDYHCSSLSVSLSCVEKKQVGAMRNYDGERYLACPYCGKRTEGNVYITGYGNRYHSTILCHELKRSVMAVPISRVGGRRACARCG